MPRLAEVTGIYPRLLPECNAGIIGLLLEFPRADRRRHPVTATLFTIGYSGHTLTSFADALRQAGVEQVIDVRRNAVSRKAGFSRRGLTEFLERQGFGYAHEPALGVPWELRDELREGKCNLAEYLRGFRVYLASERVTLERVLAAVHEKPSCLLCLERDPAECHRTVVAEELVKLARVGLQIVPLGIGAA